MGKSFRFHDVSIAVFDVHTATDVIALEAPEMLLQPAFQFLVKPAPYRAAYQSTEGLSTNTFDIRRLQIHTIRYSSFWNAFFSGPEKSLIRQQHESAWDLQLPFVAQAKSELKFNPSNAKKYFGRSKTKKFEVDAKLAVYLNTFGWSTNVKLRIRGDMTAKQLITLVEGLSNDQLFLQQNGAERERKNLTEIFKYCMTRLSNEVFTGQPHPKVQPPRRIVISLNAFTGSQTPYPLMTSEEAGLFRGILYGKTFSAAEEEAEREKEPHRLHRITISEPDNFALADWERGILVFLQRDARLGRERQKRALRRMRCFGENVRGLLVTIETINNFLRELKRLEQPNELVLQLHSSAKEIYSQLQDRYRNEVCKRYFQIQAEKIDTLLKLSRNLNGTSRDMFSQDEIHKIHEILVNRNLFDDQSIETLQGGMNKQFKARLPSGGNSSKRLLDILHILNKTEALADGEIPFATLLRIAVYLTKMFPESESLKEFLNRIVPPKTA